MSKHRFFNAPMQYLVDGEQLGSFLSLRFPGTPKGRFRFLSSLVVGANLGCPCPLFSHPSLFHNRRLKKGTLEGIYFPEAVLRKAMGSSFKGSSTVCSQGDLFLRGEGQGTPRNSSGTPRNSWGTPGNLAEFIMDP